MAIDGWDGTLGAVTARLRHATGLTQEQLAERSGLSVRAISSIECGQRHPRPFTVERLGAGLGLTADERVSLVDLADRTRNRFVSRTGDERDRRAVALVGRGPELAAIRQLVSGAGPGLLVFSGEPGIGKSRLLAEAARIAAGAGLIVLNGVCRRGAEAYAPIADALADALARPESPDPRDCAGLELVLPELAVDRPALGHSRRLALNGVTRYLTAIAGPVLLVLDDMQWTGPDTADLVAHLVRHASGRVRVVMAYRYAEVDPTDPLAACLADLARLDEARRLRLEPLDRNESERLVALCSAGATIDPARRLRILRRAGGLPLFLVELTRAAWRGTDEEPPAHLRLAVAHQLALTRSLPLLRRMATIGTAVPVERLAEWGQPLDQVVDALETARRHGLLDETRHGYRFRYPLIHELLMRGLGRNVRRLWDDQGSSSDH